MAEIKGFLKYKRKSPGYRPVKERIKDYRELELALTPEDIISQAVRCMDCGIPFCHGVGCPIQNNIPEFNELVYKGRWKQACQVLHSTNNFPEMTGRICPAPCETACTLAVNDEAVLIRHIEYQIVERGFSEGWIEPQAASEKTGKKIAVIGSGPAGLAAAQQLARAGHSVVVFEKDEKCGGLLRYGIPDFKLEKNVIDRRLKQLAEEGVEFQTGVNVGVDISAGYLKKMFDCICLTIGAGQARDLAVAGRGYENVVFALDYLAQQNKICAGEPIGETELINAEGKNVVVIGGGDTGSDCIGTAKRQGAKKIYQLEILPKPPEDRPDDTPWPNWPRVMRTSSSQQEGCERMWLIKTTKLSGAETRIQKVHACKVEWVENPKGWDLKEVAGSEFAIKADIVLIAMGFVHVQHEGLVKKLGLKLDDRGNIETNNFTTSDAGIFSAGDTVLGASLVVKAIDTGRRAAAEIDKWLMAK
ncbi:MAG: glutamate synthase subunit beta [Anaerohalosphaeraceae bacterium]|nr:glutamate synthase subunit beta [Anaerohalosphaeraceae bacterium]